MRPTLFSIFVSVLFLAAVGGCGGANGTKLAPFTGQVTYKGRPVANATITIQPKTGALGSAVTDDEGKFIAKTGTSTGVAVGTCTITVEAWAGGKSGDPVPQMSEAEAKQNPKAYSEMMKQAMMNRKQTQTTPKSLIPLKYTRLDSTPLKDIEIPASGKQDFEIKLTD
jgi:hypothetical protein